MNITEVNRGHRMNLADLSDTEFEFKVEFDRQEYWDYNLKAVDRDYEYNRSMSKSDIKYLRENCKRILQATEGAE